MASSDGKYIYAIGGCSNSEPMKTVEKYCVLTNRWELADPMRNKRCMHAVATVILSTIDVAPDCKA